LRDDIKVFTLTEGGIGLTHRRGWACLAPKG